jgi:hypothetical protein
MKADEGGRELFSGIHFGMDNLAGHITNAENYIDPCRMVFYCSFNGCRNDR